jgi:hypothetical protein
MDLESAGARAADRTLEQVFECWQAHLGTSAIGVQPMFVARDTVHMEPDVHETCLIKVVALYDGCRMAKKVLSVALDSRIMQRALKFWKTKLGAGLAVASRHLQAPADGRESAAPRKTHITHGIPAQPFLGPSWWGLIVPSRHHLALGCSSPFLFGGNFRPSFGPFLLG